MFRIGRINVNRVEHDIVDYDRSPGGGAGRIIFKGQRITRRVYFKSVIGSCGQLRCAKKTMGGGRRGRSGSLNIEGIGRRVDKIILYVGSVGGRYITGQTVKVITSGI